MIKSDILCEKADSAARERVPERRSQHASFSVGRTHEAHRQMNCCAFSGTIRTKKSKNFACLDLDAKAVQSTNRTAAGETAVFLRDLIELKHACHSTYSKRHAEDGEKTLTFPQFHNLTSIRRPVIMFTYG